MAKQATMSATDKVVTNSTVHDHDFGRWDFVKLAPLMGGISAILTVVAIVLVLTKGLNYGIDFAGGTEVQVRFTHTESMKDLREVIEAAGIANPAIQGFGGGSEFLIRLETPRAATEKESNELVNINVAKVKDALKTKLGLAEEGILAVNTVGPTVGGELKRDGFLAAFYCFLVILIYVAIRFDYKYAPGAVLCLVHDSIVTVGVYSILWREFNVQIMAAILTLIGYSLNDTIVTYDRIRETAPHFRDRPMKFIINKAVNDMLGRTFLTAGCTMIAVLALFFFGGGVIADIAFTMIIGILIGTYSSVYVAAPLILVMDWLKGKKSKTA